MNTSGEEWEPNKEALAQLTAMGIDLNAATEALFCTGNKSVEEAISYVFSREDRASGESNTSHNKSNPEGQSDEDDISYYKMVFVVNTDLKMGVGKIAAQVAHACLGLYRGMFRHKLEEDLDQWECVGEKKIVLKGIDKNHLEELHEKAKSRNIPAYLVKDAGHTQIAPGSVTVLGIFGGEEEVDEITGKLSLL